ncbi:LysR family transcriptional regulator [Pseudonocardia sp. MH-G8]|uniref:LysR family transcriptional regulator n=1 Tax=Pseudonocardia sp. MH-G8 TaxID=1854588 RepID=UPI000BA00CF9|nr:LysR family transcriptional regulator [Pseudonocardia sp. MH-G8]OZM80149.1 LysR family transcriptional regulator [Pseudonocardia sp. MH-G8]
MELRQLVYFEAVARCGGFTRAAADLHIAQPAVSAQVRRLERELGAALLARTTRRVTLTDAGALFLTRTRRVLAEIDAARRDVADVAAVLRGRVVVGATGVFGTFDLPAALAGFARRYPGVALSLHSGLLTDLVAELGSGATDLVIGPLEVSLPSACSAHPLVSDRLVLLAAPGRLSATSPVDLAGLADQPFVSLPEGAGLREALEAAVPGVRVPFEVSTAVHVRALVAAGLGLALMPASSAEVPGPEVEVHDVRPTVAHPPFGLVWREPLSPAARALQRYVVDDG